MKDKFNEEKRCYQKQGNNCLERERREGEIVEKGKDLIGDRKEDKIFAVCRGRVGM